MCFDRNINGNRDVKFLECDYLLVQWCVKLTLAMKFTNSLVCTFGIASENIYAFKIRKSLDEQNFSSINSSAFTWKKQKCI